MERYLVSAPHITVGIDVRDGRVEETYTAWRQLRGLPFEEFMARLKEMYGDQVWEAKLPSVTSTGKTTGS